MRAGWPEAAPPAWALRLRGLDPLLDLRRRRRHVTGAYHRGVPAMPRSISRGFLSAWRAVAPRAHEGLHDARRRRVRQLRRAHRAGAAAAAGRRGADRDRLRRLRRRGLLAAGARRAGRRHVALEIGDGTSIAGGCVLSAASSVARAPRADRPQRLHLGPHPRLRRHDDRAVLDQGIARVEPVEIGDGAWLGENVIVCPGVRIGRGAVVGAKCRGHRRRAGPLRRGRRPARVVRSFAPVAGSPHEARPRPRVPLPADRGRRRAALAEDRPLAARLRLRADRHHRPRPRRSATLDAARRDARRRDHGSVEVRRIPGRARDTLPSRLDRRWLGRESEPWRWWRAGELWRTEAPAPTRDIDLVYAWM